MNTKTEIWKDIPGYEGFYQVSNLGRIKSFDFRGRGGIKIRALTIGNSGYHWLTLYKKTKRTHRSIHRLVAQAFLGLDINNKKILVCHKDDNKLNNNINNLFLGTQSENMKDMKNKGRDNYIRGENIGSSKLTKQQIISIREGYLGIRGEQAGLSKILGVSHQTISKIINNKLWNYTL